MKIEHTTGKPSLTQGRWLIHGPGKIGKSTFASGWESPLFLATERRLQHLKGVSFVFIKDWKSFKEIVKELNQSSYSRKYKVIVLDVVDHLWSYCVEHTCKRLGIEHQSEEGFGKGWDAIDKEFKDTFYRLLSYPYGLIVVSHSKVVQIQSLRSSHDKFITTLPERARRIIVPHMGVIGYIDYDELPIVKNGKTRYVKCRTIRFRGTETVEAGDGEGVLPDKLRLFRDAQKTYARIKSYYDGSNKRQDV